MCAPTIGRYSGPGWATGRVGLAFIAPGQPWRNGYVKSFNGRVRDERLNIDSFWSIVTAA